MSSNELQKINNREDIIDYRISPTIIIPTILYLSLEIAELLILEEAQKKKDIFDFYFWIIVLVLLAIKCSKLYLSTYLVFITIFTLLNLFFQNDSSIRLLRKFWKTIK